MCVNCAGDQDPDRKAARAAASENIDELESRMGIKFLALRMTLQTTAGVPEAAARVLGDLQREVGVVLTILRGAVGEFGSDAEAEAAIKEAAAR